MKPKKRLLSVALAVSLVTVSVLPGYRYMSAQQSVGEYQVKQTKWKYGLGEALGFNESTYRSIDKCTTADSWRYGSVTANGEIGFIQSCDPKEDVFIFNNTKLVTDGNAIYETPVISNILDEQRKGAITRDNFPWINAVERYASSQYGTGWGTTWPRKYQPAAQYRIINNDYDSSNASNYNRYTNYETGEVGVQWKDQSGNEWNRMSFASRSDDIIVTYIEAPEGRDLDITVTMDHLVEMRNQGTTYYCPTSDYVVTEDANGYAFGMVGKYAIQNRKGNKNVKETLFARGGWGSATRIVTDGNVSYDAQKRYISVQSSFGGGALKSVNDPKLSITGTNSVVLISKVDRIDTGCNTTNDVRDQLYDELVSDIDTVISKYKVTPDLKGDRKSVV